MEKNELINLKGGEDCVTVIEYHPEAYDSKKDESGNVNHKAKVRGFRVIQNTYNEFGASVGHEVVFYDADWVKAMHEKLIEVESRPVVKMKPTDDLPF